MSRAPKYTTDQIGPEPHTPGPWTTGKGNCHLVKQDRLNGARVADCYSTGAHSARDFANARLISAAPDLLEALVEMVEEATAVAVRSFSLDDVLTDEQWQKEEPEFFALIVLARQAIAKATGAA